MKFEDYRIIEELKRSIDGLGFKKPTDIQFKAIPAIIRGEDVLAIAQTGTGKTAAFAIPVMDQIQRLKQSNTRFKGVRCVVMTPTHELAIQVAGVFKQLSKYTKLNILAIHGGVDQDPQIEALKKGVDILVATPGRLFDLRAQGHLVIERTEILILDEADHMLDLGFIDDIKDLMWHLPKKRQTLFFSATINPKIKKLAYSLVTNPIRIQISPKDPVSKNIDHTVAFIEMDDKRFFLEHLIKENEQRKLLIFVRTKVRAERVKKAMDRVNIDSDTIHSDKTDEERVKTIERFKEGTNKILIATDVSARGIDIPNIEMVVNYDLPDVSENYVHRVGRTGRGRNKGKAITFCSTEEKEMLDEIQTFLDSEIQTVKLAKDAYSSVVKQSEEGLEDVDDLMKRIEDFDEASKQMKKKRKNRKK